MRTLIRHLQFRPHGERLLTSSAAFWLFSARILVFAMAAAEAVAWGYLGFLFGDGAVRGFAATFVGALIFLVVWMIDTSLVTLDRAWYEHAVAILDSDSPRRKSRIREVLTLVLRIGLLVGSLTITAPYLAQLVFHKDIEQHMTAQAIATIDAARQRLLADQRTALVSNDREITAKRKEYELEVAGKGTTRRYGDGPAATALLASASALERERARLLEEQDHALSAFDSLSKDWAANRKELAARYNLPLPKASVLENSRILDELRKRPENHRTELAIKAFLAFIFAGLLLLKLFEPNSVRLYFSEVLQQEYDRYLAGTFDAMLPSTEMSTRNSAAMSPQRFYAFLAAVWAPARRLEEQGASSRARTAAATEDLALLERMRDHAELALNQRAIEAKRLSKQADEVNQAHVDLQSAISTVREDIELLSSELVIIDRKGSKFDERGRLEYRSYLSRKLADATLALRELDETAPTEEQRRTRILAAHEQANARLEEGRAELAQREGQIRAIRTALAASAETRARTNLGMAARYADA